ncbi:hypothetical protein TNCV_613611 [Trichonephila clavipes]|nr:hypothetical protein TNCV_613611 [Trichonephila clavipes]
MSTTKTMHHSSKSQMHLQVIVTGIARNIDRVGQGWRTSGTRAINGTQRNILGTPVIEMVCILFQNNRVHCEVLRTNPSDRSRGSGEHTLCYCLALVMSWTTVSYDAKFVYA